MTDLACAKISQVCCREWRPSVRRQSVDRRIAQGPAETQFVMWQVKPKHHAVRAAATLALTLFAFRTLALHSACACGHCNQPASASPQPVAAVPVTEHACCHPQEAPPASPGTELHDPGCTCGDQVEHAPVICADSKASTGLDPLAVWLTVTPLRVEAEPQSRESLTWHRATGPPGSRVSLFLRFRALLS